MMKIYIFACLNIPSLQVYNPKKLGDKKSQLNYGKLYFRLFGYIENKAVASCTPVFSKAFDDYHIFAGHIAGKESE
jgi:hypothetical protein